MGKVWTREGQSQGLKEKKDTFTAHGSFPAQKRASHVWTRQSAAHQTVGSQHGPSEAAQKRTTGQIESSEEQAAKRRRLIAKGRRIPEEGGVQVAHSGIQNGVATNENEKGSAFEAQAKLIAEKAAKEAAKQESLRREAEALRKRIAEEERKLADAKAAAHKKEADQAAAEKGRRRESQHLRKSRLDAGFAEAFRTTREAAASQKVSVPGADETEVKRVLGAKSDHEVMQLKPGADRATVKKKYRTMTLALHPDKCKAESATDAFQRLVHAYQGVLKYAR